MSDTEQLIAISQDEIARHSQQAEQLQSVADTLSTQSEWHRRQAENWQQYLGELTLGTPKRPTLRLVHGDPESPA